METTTLDKTLLDALKNANTKYEKLTNGYWLWHAPESFAQMIMALHIAKKMSVCVYPECTPSQIESDANRAIKPGPRPKINEQQRFDLVVWWKNERRPRAVVELKLTYASMAGVIKDAQKLIEYRKSARNIQGLKHGYLVVFNSAYRRTSLNKARQGAVTIKDRFDRATEKLSKDFKLVGQYISKESLFHEEHTHSYGIAVWRMSF